MPGEKDMGGSDRILASSKGLSKRGARTNVHPHEGERPWFQWLSSAPHPLNSETVGYVRTLLKGSADEQDAQTVLEVSRGRISTSYVFLRRNSTQGACFDDRGDGILETLGNVLKSSGSSGAIRRRLDAEVRT